MALLRRLTDSGRFAFRFVCAAWFAGSIELLRRLARVEWPTERRASEIVAAFCVCGALGAWLLWRTRRSGAREVIENSAALGFWAGVFALIV